MEKMKQGHRKGRKRPSNLREQVCPETNKLWATPAAADAVGSTGGGQGKSLRTDVRMWPTPTTRDYKGASGKGRQERKGNPADTLPNAVAMWPTPTANEDAAGTPNGKMQKMLGNHPEIRGASPEEWKRGALNPTWVEWLMGYPKGWTELED